MTDTVQDALTQRALAEVAEITRHADHLRGVLLRVAARYQALEQMDRLSDPEDSAPDVPLCDVCEGPRRLCMGCHDEPPSMPGVETVTP